MRLSLQAKVMAAVLTLLILLPATTLWVVNHRITQQTQDDAGLALITARAFFQQSLDNRAASLAPRYRNAVNDTRFQQIVRLKDNETMRQYLRSLRTELADDTELLAFTNGTDFLGEGLGAMSSMENFAAVTTQLREQALNGESGSMSLCFDGHAFTIVATPVTLPEVPDVVGALFAGVRLGEAALQKLKPPKTEILLVDHGTVVASTLETTETQAAVLDLVATANRTAQAVVIQDEHYLALAGDYERDEAGSGFGFVLLSSYEQRLQTLKQTRLTLIGLSALGIAISGIVVWFFVSRMTRPLRELRDSAEAIGRGDFSRRIEKFSNDECGELAEAFNRMTSNLQTSRVELEHAMQQLKATQEQLVQSEKLSAVGQFVAGVAHELNNPLTAVVGFSELLMSAPVDEKIRGHLDRIAKSAHRCHRIVHSLLSFARQHPPERKRVNVHLLIDEVLEIMAYDLRTSDIRIKKEFAPQVPAILADAHQLQQIFVNILGNARQAIEPHQREGLVVIRTRVADGWVWIDFQDNGPGIRREHQARIFDPFFTTKAVGKGTGLGLSLSYGLVQEHGGKIAVQSEPGQGATFTIALPVSSEGAPSVIRPGTPAPFPALTASSGKAVLVIDDEQSILDLATELLRRDGHAVETALGGREALEAIARTRFDVIISDWKMPGLNGVRLYEHLRATDPSVTNRVLFMTGDVVSDTFQEFLREHQLNCLSKPFAINEFRSAVKRLFEGKSNGPSAP